jgi:hypothetical protein
VAAPDPVSRVVLGVAGLIAVSFWLDHVRPGAGKVMDLVVNWVLALGLLVVNVRT